MADVFLSYSSKHRELTEQLAAAIAADGYTVWWDYALGSWGDYEIQIRNALSEARVVVVIWTKAAGKPSPPISFTTARQPASSPTRACSSGPPERFD